MSRPPSLRLTMEVLFATGKWWIVSPVDPQNEMGCFDVRSDWDGTVLSQHRGPDSKGFVGPVWHGNFRPFDICTIISRQSRPQSPLQNISRCRPEYREEGTVVPENHSPWQELPREMTSLKKRRNRANSDRHKIRISSIPFHVLRLHVSSLSRAVVCANL